MHPDGTGSTMGRLGWAAGGSLFAFGCLLAVTRWTRSPIQSLEHQGIQRQLTESHSPTGVVDVSSGHLQIDGKAIGSLPGKVLGVGGFSHPKLAKDLGFEAFRTWGIDSLRWALVSAEIADAMVVAGLDMTRDPKYYKGWENCRDMENSQWWASHAKTILDAVMQNKEHRRILWWIVGNELETPVPASGQDCVWKRVNWMAQKIKAIDSKHPIGIAIAWSDPSKLQRFSEICKDVDILGMNLYGNDHWGISKKLQSAGWDKPWALTECGTAAPWQVPKTSWGGLMEPLTSTSKGQFIYNGLHRCKSDAKCVGFFAFFWGWKWEKTGTWFGLLDQWRAAGGDPNGFLNDVAQPMLDEISPEWAWPVKLRIHLEGVVVHGPNKTSNGTFGFNAQKGAKVPVDLKIVATDDPNEGDIWMDWYVTEETSVNALSDGNVPEKVLPIIPHAAYHCKNGYRAVVLTEMLKPGSYRLYGFARRIRYFDHTIREASASIPFHVGQQKCQDVTSGPCYEKVWKSRTSAQRMGVSTWPASGLLPSSTFKEFQAAFYANNQGCPAPCSFDLPESFHGTCDGANWDVRVVHSTKEASELLFAKGVAQNESEPCGDAKVGEDCFWAVKWLLNTGIHQTPASFPELGKEPSFADAQLAFYNRADHGCKRPCNASMPAELFK